LIVHVAEVYEPGEFEVKRFLSVAFSVMFLSVVACIPANSSSINKGITTTNGSIKNLPLKKCLKNSVVYLDRLYTARKAKADYWTALGDYYQNKSHLENNIDAALQWVYRTAMNNAWQKAMSNKRTFAWSNRDAKKYGCLPYLPLSLS